MTFKVGHWSFRFKVDIERKKKVTQIVGNNEKFDLKKKKSPVISGVILTANMIKYICITYKMNMEDENYMLYLKQIFKIITIQSN